LKQYEMKPN